MEKSSKKISTKYYYEYLEAKTGLKKDQIKTIENKVITKLIRGNLILFYGENLESEKTASNHSFSSSYLAVTLSSIAKKINAYIKECEIPLIDNLEENEIEVTTPLIIETIVSPIDSLIEKETPIKYEEVYDSKDLVGLLQREYLNMTSEEDKQEVKALNINNQEMKSLINRFAMLYPNYLNLDETRIIMILKLGVLQKVSDGVLKKIHYSSAVIADFIGKDEQYVNLTFKKGLADFIDCYKDSLTKKVRVEPDTILELFRNELFNQIDNDLDITDNVIMSLLRGTAHKEGHIYKVQDLIDILGFNRTQIVEIIANYIDYALDIFQEEVYGTLSNLDNNQMGKVYLGGK